MLKFPKNDLYPQKYLMEVSSNSFFGRSYEFDIFIPLNSIQETKIFSFFFLFKILWNLVTLRKVS